MSHWILLPLLVVSSASVLAKAEDPPPPVVLPPATLHVNWGVDGTITALTLGTWALSGVIGDQWAPRKCHWCGTNALDAGVRNAIVWSNPQAADKISTGIAIAIPIGIGAFSFFDAYGADGVSEGAKNLILIGESVGIAGVLTELAKHTTGRARPYAYYGKSVGSSDNLSFWSGHAAEVFAVVSAGGTVARLRGYDDWPWIYAVGFSCAVTMSYFRDAGDMHWITDTLVGAAVGTGIGLLVPWLHSGPSNGSSNGDDQLAWRVVPMRDGIALDARF